MIKLLVTALIVGIPATAGGVVFPTAVQCLQKGFDHRGRELGMIVTRNTIAGAVGALGTGYLLIPLCGVLRGYALLAILQAAIASFAGWTATHRRAWLATLPAVLLVAVVGLHFSSKPDPFADPRAVESGRRRLLAWREAVDATFAVYEEPATKDRYLFINGFAAANSPLRLHAAPGAFAATSTP